MSELRPVAEHQHLVASLIPRMPAETVALDGAAGRILATAVHSPEALPAFDNSAMDGYAVRATDVAGASPEQPIELPVAADVPAGATVGRLEPGTAHRIMTGAPVPVGADTVVEVEVTDAGTDTVAIRAERAAGRAIRRTGEDVAPGDLVLEPGTSIGPAQVGLLAALGVRQVSVRRRPRVLVCSTGSELVEDPEPGSGSIRDANGPLLATAVEDAGGEAIRRRWVADDVAQFLALLDETIAEVDLVLTSGGVSAGAYEVVKDALAPRGVEFTKVAMQPGMPQGLGRYREVPVVCLPGNPVSTLVSFEVFVRPALRRALDHPRPDRPVARARLTEDLTKTGGKRQFRRGRRDLADDSVSPTGPAGSGFLGWYARADCLIDLPADVTEVHAGESVVVWDLG